MNVEKALIVLLSAYRPHWTLSLYV